MLENLILDIKYEVIVIFEYFLGFGFLLIGNVVIEEVRGNLRDLRVFDFMMFIMKLFWSEVLGKVK